MHARTKGRSGSSKPVETDLSFVKIKEKEVVDLILKLSKEDVKPSMIGLILRDQYAVPSVKKLTGKSINDILRENNLENSIPEDLFMLIERAKKLKKHLEKNTRDTHNTRGLLLMEARIRRLAKYYKRTDKLAQNWEYK